ncbi:MAG: electron transfer flavoprotein subunit alpha/FixB family protein [Deltaproteobacteria bacterium]|nr:electron transfer flavoprotein subunit alpha/FixB family protein [Deltaproteobacteria bacterium]
MSQSIVVIAEHAEGQARPITYELAAFARTLQKEMPSPDIKIVIIGDAVDSVAQAIARRTGLNVFAIRVPDLAGYNAEVYKNVLTDVLTDWRPSHVCAAHSTQGLDFAPGLAVRLGAACVTGVEAIVKQDDRICFRRAVYGGKIMADVHANSPMVLLSVLPGCFAPDPRDAASPGSVKQWTMESAPERSFSRGIIRKDANASAVTEADVIVAAGRGIGDRDHLDLIYRLAALFPKSAVAGSRIVCDNGWLDYAQQIGVTGCTVSPNLYIACGISGAIQHVSGMRGSGFIVSINTDSKAAIFNVSDVCIVEDLVTFIPILIETHEKRCEASGMNP